MYHRSPVGAFLLVAIPTFTCGILLYFICPETKDRGVEYILAEINLEIDYSKPIRDDGSAEESIGIPGEKTPNQRIPFEKKTNQRIPVDKTQNQRIPDEKRNAPAIT